MTPLVVRGPAPVLSWTPPRLPPASDDTLMRLLDLYRHTDPALARALEERMGLAGNRARRRHGRDRAAARRRVAAQVRAYFAESAGTAAKFLARAERSAHRRARLRRLGHPRRRRRDSAGGSRRCSARSTARIAAVETEMGEAWRETVVAVVTEFGRTARINGTDGTDHGTATVALLAGGALKGGRVIADWPGLKHANLHEGRDLKPTTDLRAVLKGLLKDHLRVDRSGARQQGVPGQRRREADGGAGAPDRRFAPSRRCPSVRRPARFTCSRASAGRWPPSAPRSRSASSR